jgi:hypothetical protein
MGCCPDFREEIIFSSSNRETFAIVADLDIANEGLVYSYNIKSGYIRTFSLQDMNLNLDL